MTCIAKDPRCPCQDGDACHYKDCGGTKAWPVPQAEPVAVKHGVTSPTEAQPEQEPVACRFCHSKKGCWAWQCYKCGEIDDVQQPAAQPVQEPTPWRDMVVVSLVREGIDKHKARELADHFAAQPVQEPVLQEIEQYRMQMAGISTAAIGYWKVGDGIHPDYDTVALRDVAKLYAKYDELYKFKEQS